MTDFAEFCDSLQVKFRPLPRALGHRSPADAVNSVLDALRVAGNHHKNHLMVRRLLTALMPMRELAAGTPVKGLADVDRATYICAACAKLAGVEHQAIDDAISVLDEGLPEADRAEICKWANAYLDDVNKGVNDEQGWQIVGYMRSGMNHGGAHHKVLVNEANNRALQAKMAAFEAQQAGQQK